MIYSDILSNIKTVDEANRFASEIDTLLDALFKTQGNAFEKALNSINAITSQMLKEALRKDNISFENKTMIKECLIGLRDQLQKLKVFKLSLAFEPSEISIDNLFNWVVKNIGEGCILDIETDKAILGGTIIVYEGKYEDLSLRKALEEVFAGKREEIIKPISTTGLTGITGTTGRDTFSP